VLRHTPDPAITSRITTRGRKKAHRNSVSSLVPARRMMGALSVAQMSARGFGLAQAAEPALLSVSDAAHDFDALDPALGDAEHFIAMRRLGARWIGIAFDFPPSGCDPGVAEAAKDAVDAFALEGNGMAQNDVTRGNEKPTRFPRGWSARDRAALSTGSSRVGRSRLTHNGTRRARYGDEDSEGLSLTGVSGAKRFEIDIILLPTLCVTPPLMSEIGRSPIISRRQSPHRSQHGSRQLPGAVRCRSAAISLRPHG